MSWYEDIGLNQYLQPMNAPVSAGGYVYPFLFDSNNESGVINHSAILLNAVDNAKIRNSYRAYNAVVSLTPGDGDYVDLQLAINALRDANEGGIILLRPGVYYPEAPIVLYDNISVIGVDPTTCIIDCEDMGDVSEGCIQIKGVFITGDGTIATTNGDATITGTSTEFSTDGVVAGDNLFIRGVRYEVLSVTSDTALELTSNYIGDSATGVIYTISREIENVNISNITVTDGSSATTPGAGIVISSASNIDVRNCGVYNCNNGIEMSGYDIKVINNECADNTGRGFQLGKSYSCQVRENISFNNTVTGFYLSSAASGNNTIIQGCTANGNGSYGFHFFVGQGFNLSGCIATSNNTHGFYFEGASENSISGCISQYNGVDGFHLAARISVDSERNAISGCIISNNTDDGIELTSGTTLNIVATCVIEDNGGTDIVDAGTGNDTFNNI